MEKLLMNNEMKDDFVVKSIRTEELPTNDDNWSLARPYVTHGQAERADGSTVTFAFFHNEHHVLAPGLVGSHEVGELKLGFYLRKAVEATESNIIQIGNNRQN